MAGSFQISSVRYIIVMCCFLLNLNYSSIYFHSIIAAEYANLELIPPYLHPGYNRYIDGANFASGGAGALDETRQGLVHISVQVILNIADLNAYPMTCHFK